MAMSDPLGDMLTRIRNGQRAGFSSIRAPGSRLRANVLDVLKREGYIRDFRSEALSNGGGELVIELKYAEGTPVIREISRVSKPGRRVYSKIKELPKLLQRPGYQAILSTPRGVMSDHEARAANVGGEILCRSILGGAGDDVTYRQESGSRSPTGVEVKPSMALTRSAPRASWASSARTFTEDVTIGRR